MHRLYDIRSLLLSILNYKTVITLKYYNIIVFFCLSDSRLINFDVKVENTRNEELCFRQETAVAKGAWLQRDCPKPLLGRFVSIRMFDQNPITKEEILTLCEVRVMAESK